MCLCDCNVSKPSYYYKVVLPNGITFTAWATSIEIVRGQHRNAEVTQIENPEKTNEQR